MLGHCLTLAIQPEYVLVIELALQVALESLQVLFDNTPA